MIARVNEHTLCRAAGLEGSIVPILCCRRKQGEMAQLPPDYGKGEAVILTLPDDEDQCQHEPHSGH